ncbi:MAG: carbon-nitrogen hydrolase family protein [Ignisphaera sp.]
MQLNSINIDVAVIHTSIELGTRKRNIAKIKDLLEKLLKHQRYVDIVILPQMVNGVPIYEIEFKKTLKISSETIPGPTTDEMGKLARNYGVNLVVGPLIERRGSRLYRSVVCIGKDGDVKKVIRQVAPNNKFSGYSQVPYMVLGNARIGFLIADDLFYPEISFTFSILNIDIIVIYPSINQDIYRQQQATVVRTIESGSMGLMVGGIFEYKQDVLATVPTIVIDENGEEIERIDMDEKVVAMSVSTKHVDRVNVNARFKIIKELKKMLHSKKFSSQNT